MQKGKIYISKELKIVVILTDTDEDKLIGTVVRTDNESFDLGDNVWIEQILFEEYIGAITLNNCSFSC